MTAICFCQKVWISRIAFAIGCENRSIGLLRGLLPGNSGILGTLAETRSTVTFFGLSARAVVIVPFVSTSAGLLTGVGTEPTAAFSCFDTGAEVAKVGGEAGDEAEGEVGAVVAGVLIGSFAAVCARLAKSGAGNTLSRRPSGRTDGGTISCRTGFTVITGFSPFAGGGHTSLLPLAAEGSGLTLATTGLGCAGNTCGTITTICSNPGCGAGLSLPETATVRALCGVAVVVFSLGRSFVSAVRICFGAG
ncbi:MAG TPA: hypothetical protein VGL38_09935 [bacterium]